jgi:hypothetical protein
MHSTRDEKAPGRDWSLDYKLTHRTYEAGDMSDIRNEKVMADFGQYKPNVMHAAKGRV